MGYLAITDDDRDEHGRIIVNQGTTEAAQLYEETRAAIMGNGVAPAADTPEEPASRPRQALPPLNGDTARLIATVVLFVIAALLWGMFRQGATSAPPLAQTTPATSLPTAAPTIAPTPPSQKAYEEPHGRLMGTIPLTVTIDYQHSGYPGWGGVKWDGGVKWVETNAPLAGLPDLASPPTLAPRSPSIPASAPAPIEAPCDPQVNPRYVVEIDLGPAGSARGVSCDSQAEAQANADAYAAPIIARETAEAAP